MAIIAMTSLTGCPGGKPEPQPEPQPEPKDLVVVTQTDSISGTHEENSAYSASITLDAPVEGPQALLDAVMALANDELYAFCEFCRTLAMEAQTDLFVTYGVEHFHCGASCGSEKYFYTFDKKDGHLIGDVISHENLVRFFEEHPECATIEKSEENLGWTFNPEDEYENTQFGLLADSFILVIEGVSNQYIVSKIPYDLISSYLSPEAQALVKK